MHPLNRFRVSAAVASMAALLCAPAPALAADPPCGVVEVRFKPGASNMQVVVWIEDKGGKVLDTPYITRFTGQFGLGNRPGTPLLKTNFRWPYGRREMVAPVWAHRRDHHYPKVLMGGVCGWSPQTLCPGGAACGGDCEDSTIAYHSRVSSYEPFYCSPSGASMIDAMTCASKGTFAKGAYAPFPMTYSLYPPRADLNAYDKSVDSVDTLDFAKQNDLSAVSQATPPANKAIDPPVDWFPNMLAEGDYVAWVELSQESDFNGAHNHPNQPDTVNQWDFEGHPFLGQPSIVYKVPFHYSALGDSAIATSYAGYSTWDGSDGTLHGPDGSITANAPGTGAGRLLDVNDTIDIYRVKVVVGSCVLPPAPDAGSDDLDAGDAGVGDGGSTPRDAGTVMPPVCKAPAPVESFVVVPSSSSISVSWNGPTSGALPNRFSVRYREGTKPITDDEFKDALAAWDGSATAPGAQYQVSITGLIAKTSYAVAVRGVSACSKPSPAVSQVAMTSDQKFTTLSGCFVATAAYGSEMEKDVQALRRFRDRSLLTNTAGQLFVASYYAFGPSLAGAISGDPGLRGLARAALRPLVDVVRGAGF